MACIQFHLIIIRYLFINCNQGSVDIDLAVFIIVIILRLHCKAKTIRRRSRNRVYIQSSLALSITRFPRVKTRNGLHSSPLPSPGLVSSVIHSIKFALRVFTLRKRVKAETILPFLTSLDWSSPFLPFSNRPASNKTSILNGSSRKEVYSINIRKISLLDT